MSAQVDLAEAGRNRTHDRPALGGTWGNNLWHFPAIAAVSIAPFPPGCPTVRAQNTHSGAALPRAWTWGIVGVNTADTLTTVLVLRGGGYEKNFLLPEGIGVKGGIALGLIKAGIAWWCHWVADRLHRRGHTRFAKIIAAVEMALPAVGVVNNSAMLLRR